MKQHLSASLFSTRGACGPARSDTARRKGANSNVSVRTAAISSPKKSWPRAASAIDNVDLPAAFSPAIKTPSLPMRSEEHTSELQSLTNLVCRLLLEKKKKKKYTY